MCRQRGPPFTAAQGAETVPGHGAGVRRELCSFGSCWRTERRRRTKIAPGRCLGIVVLHQQPVGSLDRVDVTRTGARTRARGSGVTVSSAARPSFGASFVTERSTHTVVTAADRALNKLCNECSHSALSAFVQHPGGGEIANVPAGAGKEGVGAVSWRRKRSSACGTLLRRTSQCWLSSWPSNETQTTLVRRSAASPEPR